MTLLMTTTLLFTSTTFMLMKTPVSMMTILILQTISISIVSSIMITSFWYSYMLIMIMISGLLVLFMYMASIAANEEFKMNFKKMSITIMINILVATNMNSQNPMMPKKMSNMDLQTKQEMVMMKLYSTKLLTPSMLMFMLLFVLMMMVSFMVSTTSGPMRKSN